MMNTITNKLNQFIAFNESPVTMALKKKTSELSKQTADTVSLSPEGKAKAVEDEVKSALNKALHGIVGNDEEVNEATSSDPLDKQIKLLQEKIRELNQSIKQLEGKDDEASIKQREVLIEQRNEYTFQLLELYNEKLQATKQS